MNECNYEIRRNTAIAAKWRDHRTMFARIGIDCTSRSRPLLHNLWRDKLCAERPAHLHQVNWCTVTVVIKVIYYSAMLWIARIVLSQDVLPSVMRRYSIETAKHIITLFHHRVATPFYFSISNGVIISDRDPANGGVECKGVWKNRDFRPISRIISKMI